MNCEFAPECRHSISVRTGTGLAVCADHARMLVANDPRVRLVSLIDPPGDRVVILPDKEDFEFGKLTIVIPESVRGKKREYGTGLVLAVGPGSTDRRRLTDDCFSKTRTPMYAPLGARVVWKQKHEGVVHTWRGVKICHDFDVLAILESE